MITYVNGQNDVLSNFFLSSLEYDGDVFKSAEHLYQSRNAIFHETFNQTST